MHNGNSSTSAAVAIVAIIFIALVAYFAIETIQQRNSEGSNVNLELPNVFPDSEDQ